MSGSPSRSMRADELLVLQGAAESRTKAKAMIVAGEVRAGSRLITKPAEMLSSDVVLQVRERPPYVSRGGVKLAHALDIFGLDVDGFVAADIGASTGGFTDVLLQRGAAKVYAIDVGYGQLDLRIRDDPRVVVMERVNARYIDVLPEAVDLCVIDVSFISLSLILPTARRVLRPDGQVIALIKPQFEAGRDAVGRGGVVRDEGVRRAVVERVVGAAEQIGFGLRGLTRSPISGPAGNDEFLAYFTRDPVAKHQRDQRVSDVFTSEGSRSAQAARRAT